MFCSASSGKVPDPKKILYSLAILWINLMIYSLVIFLFALQSNQYLERSLFCSWLRSFTIAAPVKFIVYSRIFYINGSYLLNYYLEKCFVNIYFLCLLFNLARSFLSPSLRRTASSILSMWLVAERINKFETFLFPSIIDKNFEITSPLFLLSSLSRLGKADSIQSIEIKVANQGHTLALQNRF